MEIKVSGHLRKKNGMFYCALSYKDKDGKRKQTLRGTGLPIKNNIRNAEGILKQFIINLEDELNGEKKTLAVSSPDGILFSDYMLKWLDSVKPTIEETTYQGYCYSVKTVIVPYFKNKGIMLNELEACHIQDFYDEMLIEGKSANTVKHFNANISAALKKARISKLVTGNPLENLKTPSIKKFRGKVYSSEQLNTLLSEIEGSIWEIPIIFAGLYGLRRSEVLGLKYSSIDFKNKCFTVEHTVTSVKVDNERKIIKRDGTKTEESQRTLPLDDVFINILLAKKANQERYRKLCGNSYCKTDIDYVCVNELGQLIKPDQLSRKFKYLARQAGLEEIRFHDLRHTAGSLLLNGGASMKQIQEWLGHSDYGTTANIYSHLDKSSKKAVGSMISNLYQPNKKQEDAISNAE